jgi:hypothetical protein
MKRIMLAVVCLAAVGGTVYALQPEEVRPYAAVAEQAAVRAWEAVAANPGPVIFAVATFFLTVVYHKARGKSLRESVEVAATRVAVVPVPTPALEADNPVLRRAKARATRAQLIADQIGLQNRLRKLPESVVKAEKEACYAEQALTDAERALANAERTLADRRKAHEEALAALEAARKERAKGEAELAEIEAELRKLAELV